MKIKILNSLLGVCVISGMTFCLATLTSCSHNPSSPNLNAYYNTVGTDWYGYKSGKIDMLLNNENSTATIVGNNKYSAKNLYIPQNVIDRSTNKTYRLTGIANKSFYESNTLKGNIIFPQTLQTIGASAFEDCTWVSGDLTIPNSVTNIGHSAFHDSGFEGHLTLGSNLLTIGDMAFYDCEHLVGDLVIPDSVVTIGNAAFSGCESLDGELTLPRHLIDINPSVFYNDIRLHGHLILNDGLQTIGNYAFEWCEKFSGDINIPHTVTSIGSGSFHGCSGFLKVIVPISVQEIKSDAFDECNENLNLFLDGCTEGEPTTTYTGSLAALINSWWNNGNPADFLDLGSHRFMLNQIFWHGKI